jgi:hypothetical protein
MKGCPDGVPWHRVVNAAGGISFRANVAGMLTQRMLLEREGVCLRRGRVPLRDYQWRSRPLGAGARSRLGEPEGGGVGGVEGRAGVSPGARAGSGQRVRLEGEGVGGVEARAGVSPGARA